MNIFRDKQIKLNNSAVALGKFDGVHLGHKLLIDSVCRLQVQGFNGVIFTFDMLENSVFDISKMKNIYSKEEKIECMENFGVDNLILYPFDDEFAAMPPENFIKDILIDKLDAKYIIVGEDYRFGAHRKGDIEILKQYEKLYGYQLIAIPKKVMDGQVISSTEIRGLIEQGQMKKTAMLLGRPYKIEGQVVKGRQLGRTIGIPTANILPVDGKLYPPSGVYASEVIVGGRKIIYRGITNIGDNPTVNDRGNITIESFIFDFDEEIYGMNIEIIFYERIREEKKFASVKELKSQMLKDIEEAKKLL